MLKTLILICTLLLSLIAVAKTTIVKNPEELKAANATAKAGDIIVLQNGEWKNVSIELNCKGTKENPITFKAEITGKVLITGLSNLSIGGSYIIVDGLYFTNGYAGKSAVIKFSIDNDQLANHCRVTNTVINDFNNPKRLEENYWVAFSGKKNRLDHCSFINKKNIGVLLAVLLDDERSRENNHSIDHNYFGYRLPLASNGGEIIRVGVSQHCEFNSNTLIENNYFDNCDGETEIVSIKSGNNFIRKNLFKECQGSVVLRHGDNNTVENNIFLGNNKSGTGGVRIINKGQWVVNNLFYQCKGEGFRSPLSIMNGVPNSPAHRYVPVTDAVIANNTYIDCTPLSLCEGSDTERSVPPAKVQFLNNLFYSTQSTPLAFIHDDISGINFSGNVINKMVKPNIPAGFTIVNIAPGKSTILPITPGKDAISYTISDSLKSAALARLSAPLKANPGFSDANILASIEKNAYADCGAKWFDAKNLRASVKPIRKDCKNADEIVALFSSNQHAPIVINLTGTEYTFSTPLNISNSATFMSFQKQPVTFSTSQPADPFLFQLVAGHSLHLKNLNINLREFKGATFIATDTSGSSRHANLKVENCTISNLNGTLLSASKTSVSDSIVIRNSSFPNGNGLLFNFSPETDKKGYYNVEKLIISNSIFNNHTGQMLTMLRGGNDESTMGPNLHLTNNKITNCNTINGEAFIHLYGTQVSLIENNQFTNCNSGNTLIHFEDAVKAKHLLRNNVMSASGKIIRNKYVTETNSVIR
jgi:poly(beta-D-mannuronate) lyase